MASISVPTAIMIGAGVSGAAVLGGSLISSNAAQSAANKQLKAANAASQLQWNEFQQTQQNLQPYMTAGTTGLSEAEKLLGLGPSGSFNPSTIEATLSQLPGYQFVKQQGLEATQAGFAGEGLASSGAALKGAAQYSTGLADTYYQQFLNNYLGLAQQGENAAAGVGWQGLQAAGQAGQFATSGAAASAAGTVGAANALTSGLSGIGSNLSSALLLSSLYNNGMFGATVGTGGSIAPVGVTPSVFGTGGFPAPYIPSGGYPTIGGT